MRDIVVIQNPQIYAYELVPDQEADLKEEIMATVTQNSVEEQETTTTSQLSDIQAVVKFCLIRKNKNSSLLKKIVKTSCVNLTNFLWPKKKKDSSYQITEFSCCR